MLWTNFLYGTSTFSLFPRHWVWFFGIQGIQKKIGNEIWNSVQFSTAPIWPFRFWSCRTCQEHQHLVMTIIRHLRLQNCMKTVHITPYTYFFLSQNHAWKHWSPRFAFNTETQHKNIQMRLFRSILRDKARWRARRARFLGCFFDWIDLCNFITQHKCHTDNTPKIIYWCLNAQTPTDAAALRKQTAGATLSQIFSSNVRTGT
jgi:hypothetical protein